jgi:hypothetical protein
MRYRSSAKANGRRFGAPVKLGGSALVLQGQRSGPRLRRRQAPTAPSGKIERNRALYAQAADFARLRADPVQHWMITGDLLLAKTRLEPVEAQEGAR